METMLLATLLYWIACTLAVIAFHCRRREQRRRFAQKLRAVFDYLEKA